jgi:K+/H+ antiporter YhaU regulatory subunit KhtT
MLFNPPAETLISAGDYLIVMGEPNNLRTLENTMSVGAGS